MLVALLDLAAEVHQERAVGGVDDLGALDLADRRGDLVAVLLAGGVDRDVAQRVRVVDGDQVDGPDRAAGGADRARDAPEHARPVRDPDPHDDRVLG